MPLYTNILTTLLWISLCLGVYDRGYSISGVSIDPRWFNIQIFSASEDLMVPLVILAL